jgi:hypothetical protein
MVKMRTAIDELQVLASSNQDDGKTTDRPHPTHRRKPNAESFLYEELQGPVRAILQLDESVT